MLTVPDAFTQQSSSLLRRFRLRYPLFERAQRKEQSNILHNGEVIDQYMLARFSRWELGTGLIRTTYLVLGDDEGEGKLLVRSNG
jgi:hypothetical protein